MEVLRQGYYSVERALVSRRRLGRRKVRLSNRRAQCRNTV